MRAELVAVPCSDVSQLVRVGNGVDARDSAVGSKVDGQHGNDPARARDDDALARR
jgi:hypothetical protein